jgi:asparagine synthase (glutamine-hydrolysing)
MCGIVGIFSNKGLAGCRDALQRANDIVDYRGPDGEGFVLFKQEDLGRWAAIRANKLPLEGFEMARMKAALGHRRLAIIDLSTQGLQPMSNENQSLWITYNGEVYNYLEIRAELERAGYLFRSHSDTEVILSAYREWGEECVHRFNGMWAFAIVDLKQEKIFCSRDRFGVKPFHYYSNGQYFLFSSEIKQLLCFPFLRKRINERAVFEYLAYAAVDYCEETFFADIYKLLPGHNLVLDMGNGSVNKKCYYCPQFRINESVSLSEAQREFRRLLTDSVRLRLRSDVEVGSCLSGGLDSSSIVCIMHKLLQEQEKGDIQRTFSSHFEEKEANELEYMQTVIRATAVRAHFTYPTSEEFLQDMERLVWHQEEPFGSTSIFAQWSVFKLVHQHGIKVMLDGQGADEALAGYISVIPYYFKELRAKGRRLNLLREQWANMRFRRGSWLSLLPSQLRSWLQTWAFKKTVPPSPAIDWITPELTEPFGSQSIFLSNQRKIPFGELESLNNLLYQLTFLNNLQSLLHYEDRNSMAFSVESRVPFLDYRIIEFLFTLPSNYKIRDGYTKRIMRDGMDGLLPEKIRWRVSKLGFATPELFWRRTLFPPLIAKLIEENRVGSFILYDKAKSYFNQIEKHNLPDSAPWRWINLHLWMKVYGLTR